MIEVVERGADFSPCERFRYSLYRRLAIDDSEAVITWIMLNPSTADAIQDDPTIRRCMGFSAQWGFPHVYITNVFAYRATDPKELRRAIDPHGPDNDLWIKRRTDLSMITQVMFAWGTHGAYLDMGPRIEQWVRELRKEVGCYTLGRTKAGHPKHPLYLAKNTELQNV